MRYRRRLCLAYLQSSPTALQTGSQRFDRIKTCSSVRPIHAKLNAKMSTTPQNPVKDTVQSTKSTSLSTSTSVSTPASAPTSTSPTEFVILGSGVSTGIPRISCIIRPTSEYTCATCHHAMYTQGSKNRRCNVSALVRAAGKTVLIDCGKTIREAAMTHFPSLGVRNVDAIVLTHGHADAVLGLDDARDIQFGPKRIVTDGTVTWGDNVPTPVYLNESTAAVCHRSFPYLIPKTNQDDSNNKRRVSALEWNIYGENEYFTPFKPVADAPIEFIPLPMLHGGDYICMGFLITISNPNDADAQDTVIAYLSDLSALPSASLRFLKDLPRIDLLVVDMLTNNQMNFAHFSKDDAKAFVRQLRPRDAVAVGMTCSLGLHDDVNAELAEMGEEGLSFRLAYDGERFPC